MNKKLLFLNILFVIGLLLSAWGFAGGTMPVSNQASSAHNASLALQATAEPPIPFPTIVINNPGSGGGAPAFAPTTMLLYILVGAVILIALIAVLRR